MEQQPTPLEQKAAQKLTREGAKLLFEYLKKEGGNPHLDHLIEVLAGDASGVGELYTYGMQHLPADEQRPDRVLANYFFFLSEISGVVDEVKSFAMDCMVYCETDMYDGIAKRENILSEFEKVKPLLA